MDKTKPIVVTVETADGYRVEATHRGHTLTMDEPTEAGGTDQGMTPVQTMLSALGGCAAITMTMYARRKGWPLESAKVTVTLEPAGAPDAPRLKDIAGKCPVHRMLAGPTVLEDVLA
jgi:putative redox protein